MLRAAWSIQLSLPLMNDLGYLLQDLREHLPRLYESLLRGYLVERMLG